MPMDVYDHTKSVWAVAAERHLRQALNDIESGRDAIPEVNAGMACLRIEAGELPPDEGLLETDEEPDPQAASARPGAPEWYWSRP